MKKVTGVLILCVFALCLSACSILNLDVGPCYGHGCPAFAPKNTPPPQATAAENGGAPAGVARTVTANAAPEPQAKRGQ
jgi:hypothetical protein